jgi:hypothetical protein
MKERATEDPICLEYRIFDCVRLLLWLGCHIKNARANFPRANKLISLAVDRECEDYQYAELNLADFLFLFIDAPSIGDSHVSRIIGRYHDLHLYYDRTDQTVTLFEQNRGIDNDYYSPVKLFVKEYHKLKEHLPLLAFQCEIRGMQTKSEKPCAWALSLMRKREEEVNDDEYEWDRHEDADY